MKPENRLSAIILGYCALLWVTNWSLSQEYARDVGQTASSLDLRGFGAVFGCIASVILARRIWRVFRSLLEARIRIPTSVRLWGSWSILWLLVPLAFGLDHHSAGVAEDGARITTVFEYGGEASLASIAFSAVAIMLFQLLVRLEAFNPENQHSRRTGSANAVPRVAHP